MPIWSPLNVDGEDETGGRADTSEREFNSTDSDNHPWREGNHISSVITSDGSRCVWRLRDRDRGNWRGTTNPFLPCWINFEQNWISFQPTISFLIQREAKKLLLKLTNLHNFNIFIRLEYVKTLSSAGLSERSRMLPIPRFVITKHK